MRDREVIASEILELQIKMARLCIELSLADGEPDAADEWKRTMVNLISLRSQEQIARMEAAIDRDWWTF